jgi:hypothetical protein
MIEIELRIIKKATTDSLSGKSLLHYEIGCKEDKTLHARIIGNTGKGLYFKGWTPLAPILSSDQKLITAGSVRFLFEGRSSNSAGFYLAILRNEGLIKNVKDSQRSYERCDPAVFIKHVQSLIDVEPPPQKKKAKKSAEADQESP